MHIEHMNDIETAWNFWHTNLMKVIDKHAPCVTKRGRHIRCPWITPDTIKMMRERDYLLKKAPISNDPDFWKVINRISSMSTHDDIPNSIIIG